VGYGGVLLQVILRQYWALSQTTTRSDRYLFSTVFHMLKWQVESVYGVRLFILMHNQVLLSLVGICNDCLLLVKLCGCTSLASELAAEDFNNTRRSSYITDVNLTESDGRTSFYVKI